MSSSLSFSHTRRGGHTHSLTCRSHTQSRGHTHSHLPLSHRVEDTFILTSKLKRRVESTRTPTPSLSLSLSLSRTHNGGTLSLTLSLTHEYSHYPTYIQKRAHSLTIHSHTQRRANTLTPLPRKDSRAHSLQLSFTQRLVGTPTRTFTRSKPPTLTYSPIVRSHA